MKYLIYSFLILVLLAALIVYPFIPGEYDFLGFSLSMIIQLYSAVGLLTCIPAILWLYQVIRYMGKNKGETTLQRLKLFRKIYAWSVCLAGLLVIFFTMLGISLLMGIGEFAGLFLLVRSQLKKTAGLNAGSRHSFFVPAGLALLPIALLCFQLIIARPLTGWSRARAIARSYELIDEIERYKGKYGRYPLTLNGIWKDYKTGIRGIEKYGYTYDDTSYSLYFEQPRLLFDRFGTREFVVYNPTDDHLMLSHASWHMLLGPGQRRQTQGWYAAADAGPSHWKYFWFD